MRVTATTILLAALCAMASPCPAQTTNGAPQPADERRTLSLRTSEGLVVVDCLCSEIDRITKMLAAEPSPPRDNRGLFLWLMEAGVPADSVRMYTAETSAPETNRGLPDMKWKSTTVAEAVRNGEIPDITGRELFEAYMILRATGAEVYLDETTVVQAGGPDFLLPHTVFVLSTGYLDGYHGIFVDGANHSTGSPSYNIVAFTPDSAETAVSESFNLFESPDSAERMAAFLNGLPAGTIILVSVKTGPGVFLSGDAVSALRSFGSAVSLDPEVLSSHAMIGKKGWAPGEALEATAVNMGSRAVYFDGRLYVDPARAEAEIAPSGGRCVILSGANRDSAIHIYGRM